MKKTPKTPPLGFSNEISMHNRMIDEQDSQESPKKSTFGIWFNSKKKQQDENNNDEFCKAFERMLELRDIPLPVRHQLRAMDNRKKENILKASEVAAPTTKTNEPSQSKLKPKSGQSTNADRSPEKSNKQSNSLTGASGNIEKADNPILFAKMLEKEHSTTLSIDKVKRLRQLIRAESSRWLYDFFDAGGYEGLCSSLSEILKVEWRYVFILRLSMCLIIATREEQHDDQILHELMRCFKGLSTSEIGLHALSSKAPEPYKSLVDLLFTDKKPGSLPTRQLMMELISLIFEIFGEKSSSDQLIKSPTTQSYLSNVNGSTDSAQIQPLKVPTPFTSAGDMVRQLIHNPINQALESQHEFIKIAKRPRVYKLFLSEMYEVQRDFFWFVFFNLSTYTNSNDDRCFGHKNNGIWYYPSVDMRQVERLRFRVPGGMTAGVEYEAIGYLTSIFSLINALSAASFNDGEETSKNLHKDLFASGIDRYIYTSRAASLAHYPLLHYNISLYLHLAKQSGFSIPNVIARYITQPPENVRIKK
ncbi:hypothetical protein E3P89_02456 [Wallemia ichthyophaga]|uniref:Formin GTPase-binding domain-containing protein n=1 Tax=Wallemia ichthyophaga TaxID=245174 RepID=A0A4T0HAB4_WALIC|nr:hypothetical protein E3P95_02356 [Wallemia ichthyophaga]TIA99653.1 hypothetical protein E3P94_02457 [Wallemia ichthyophaga]TIB11237.1 hypothetical protein E3P90_02507 [Wallemia ichthyophaga]TIB11968.1 hypothetical protein E3P93_02404 [Wallemia ichthyophaga]TIB21772.1 hypothetical protein E3P89_02456 [Wallemia ichthyophaga]